MYFCKECEFMLYTRLVKDKNKLEHYCQNCSWSGSDHFDQNKSSICVYSKNYSNDFIALKTLTNKHTLDDPTLPRINNIECPNVKCLTNLDDINTDLTCHLKNTQLFNSEKTTIIDKLVSMGLQEDSIELQNINKNEMLAVLNTKESYDKLMEMKVIDIEGVQVLVNEYVKPNREIVFMKYDNKNLKYLYMCSVCKTTWKTE